MNATTARLLRATWPPVVFGGALLLAWQGAVKLFDWKPYFLPTPLSIADRIQEHFPLIRAATWVSGMNALVGLLAGTVAGVVVAFALMRFRMLNELVTPLAIALNAIPIVVLVGVLSKLYPPTSEVPRRVMVMLVVYFVILVNVAKGLRQVQPTHLELLRSYAAGPFAVIRKARIPNAVPYLFTALRIAAPTAVITAFVAEYFGGQQNGIGYRITTYLRRDAALGWAFVFAAIALGLAFYLISIALESLINQQRGRGPQGEHT
ncbi:MAG: ABC transporter permease subunit [Actinomycetota bacterium]|nr:ABC transporter permease subunit [Actinomycetota bacterium]